MRPLAALPVGARVVLASFAAAVEPPGRSLPVDDARVATLARRPGALRLRARTLRHGRTSRAAFRRLRVRRRPPLVHRLQLVYELEIHGHLPDSSAEEEGQQREGGCVRRAVGRGGHVPRALERLALQAQILRHRSMSFRPTAGAACPRKRARALNSSWTGAWVLVGVAASQASKAAVPAAVIS